MGFPILVCKTTACHSEMQTAGTAGSSAASNSEQVGSLQSEPAKRKSDDVGWDYGELTVPNNYDKIKCKLCDKAFSGGIYRLKQHIAGLRGNVKACPKSTPLDKSRCLQALEGSKKRRHDKKEHIEEVRGDVTISKDSDDVVELDSGGSKPIRQLGPMDQFARAIDPDASMKKTRQQNINDAISKNRTNEVHTYLAKWVYGAGIPFNAINNDDFHRFCEAVGQFGPGYIPSFWTSLLMCFELFKPLVKVLRLVDGDWRPSMGFVYGELKDAKKEIIKLCKERNCNEISEPIIQIIDSRAKDRLDSPLHLAGYLLNPYYYYRDDEAQKDPACMTAILTCIEAFFPDDFHVQHLVSNIELLKYKGMEGMFGKKMAKIGRMANNDTLDVVGWWSNYGAETPNLQMMAMKILSLTSSSSGCERNWSTFEGIHTKKRNRLDAVRMSHLVYVQFNSKLLNKKKKMKEKYDILVANDASMAQGWIVDGGDDDEELSLDSNITSEDIGEVTGRIVRELDEEDFQSEDEVNNNENLMFDFDESDMQGW